MCNISPEGNTAQGEAKCCIGLETSTTITNAIIFHHPCDLKKAHCSYCTATLVHATPLFNVAMSRLHVGSKVYVVGKVT